MLSSSVAYPFGSSDPGVVCVKRGQAALEFLTTYGWAFLVVLVVIGALAYFGVLNPSRFLPERCTFQSEFACTDHILIKQGNNMNLTMKLMSNYGTGVVLTEFNATVQSTRWYADSCIIVGNISSTISSSETVYVICQFVVPADASQSLPSEGSKLRIMVNGFYKEPGGFNHPLAGEVYAAYQG